MMRRIVLSLAVLAGLLAVSAQAPAKAPQSYTLEDLKRVEQQRDEALKRLKKLETQGAKVSRESTAVDADLLAAAADSQRREEQAAAAEVRLADLSAQADIARAQLIGDKAAQDDLLAALMTFGSRRPPALAISPDDTAAAIRAAILMGDAAPALSARARDLAIKIDRLNTLAEGVKREKTTLSEADQAIAARRQQIEALAQEKRLARTSLAAETASLRAETERLGRQADTLRDLLDSLAAAAPPSPSTKPGQARAGRIKPGPTRPGGPTIAPRPNDLPGGSPQAAAPRPGAPGAASPLVPVVGKRTRKFGQKIDGVGSPGLTLATRAGAQVIAPLDARVEYAGVFRSYGQMLILDVGGDILVVVSGIDAIYPEAGQWVLAGEPIGRMADQRSPSPELYLEIRRNGQPIDPEKWLGRGA